ncbi:MAG: MXAN_5187 C-terminal domain-containing protein [Acidobacteriota bacterium]
MADPNDIQRDLLQLEAELKRLEAEYNMFFAGRLPRPPWETRGRVDALIKRWDRGYIQTSIDRFRFNSLQTRYATFCDLWDRGMRAKEEGRPGPFVHQAPPKAGKPAEGEKDRATGPRVVNVTSLTDPTKEMDKVQAMYDSLMDAQRQSGGDVVPFQKFAALVQDQVKKLRDKGSPEVAFRVAVKDGKVSFTARGIKQDD